MNVFLQNVRFNFLYIDLYSFGRTWIYPESKIPYNLLRYVVEGRANFFIDGKEEHFLLHETKEEDEDRTRIYHSTEMDGAIQYGKPGKKPPLWLHGIMVKEMKYFNDIMHGMEPSEEFKPLLTGEAARAAIATAAPF